MPRRGAHTPTFDLTPMVDVVLLLMIFFLYTTQLSQLQRTNVDLPEEAGEVESEDRPGAVVIDLHADGSLYVQAKPTTRQELLARIDRAIAMSAGDAESLDLLIRPDKDSPAASLNALARDLADRGVRTWRLGTSPTQ